MHVAVVTRLELETDLHVRFSLKNCACIISR